MEFGLWLALVACQIGLAVSELVLLRQIFVEGMGFAEPQALTASLSVACVAYYYCLFGGYQAVFRTDALQFSFILLMGAYLFALLWVPEVRIENPADAVAPLISIPILGIPFVQRTLEFFAGVGLGMMPILAAPDAWKRMMIVARRFPKQTPKEKHKPAGSLSQRWSGRVRRLARTWVRSAPIRLLLATAVPVGLSTPILIKVGSGGPGDSWAFPLRQLFAMCDGVGEGLVLLGMISAFLSTFDGAQVSAIHVLMKQPRVKKVPLANGLQRYRVSLGVAFVLIVVLFLIAVSEAPNPYYLGAVLITPFGGVAGILLGARFGRRTLPSSPFVIMLSITFVFWSILAVLYLIDSKASVEPYRATPLVACGCCVFFLFATAGALFGVPKGEDRSEKEGI
jgi:Na+/proline symporter